MGNVVGAQLIVCFTAWKRDKESEVTLVQLICLHPSSPSHMKPTWPLWNFFFFAPLPLDVSTRQDETRTFHILLLSAAKLIFVFR